MRWMYGLATGLAWLSLSGVPAVSAERPNLAGTWALNASQSDDPRARLKEAGIQPPPEEEGSLVPTELRIQQSGDEIQIQAGDESSSYVVDGKPREREIAQGITIQITAAWQDTKLVTTVSGGPAKFTTTYETSSDGRQLIITRLLENPEIFKKPIQVRSVYDRK